MPLDFSKLNSAKGASTRRKGRVDPPAKPHYQLVDSAPSISADDIFAHIKDIGLASGSNFFVRHPFGSDESADASAEQLAKALVIPFLIGIGFAVE